MIKRKYIRHITRRRFFFIIVLVLFFIAICLYVRTSQKPPLHPRKLLCRRDLGVDLDDYNLQYTDIDFMVTFPLLPLMEGDMQYPDVELDKDEENPQKYISRLLQDVDKIIEQSKEIEETIVSGPLGLEYIENLSHIRDLTPLPDTLSIPSEIYNGTDVLDALLEFSKPYEYPLFTLHNTSIAGWGSQYGVLNRPRSGDAPLPLFSETTADLAVLLSNGSDKMNFSLRSDYIMDSLRDQPGRVYYYDYDNMNEDQPKHKERNEAIDSALSSINFIEEEAKKYEGEESILSKGGPCASSAFKNYWSARQIHRASIFVAITPTVDLLDHDLPPGEGYWCAGFLVDLYARAAYPQRLYVGLVEEAYTTDSVGEDSRATRSHCLPGRHYNRFGVGKKGKDVILDTEPRGTQQDPFRYCQLRKFCPTDNIRHRLVVRQAFNRQKRSSAHAHFLSLLLYRGEHYVLLLDGMKLPDRSSPRLAAHFDVALVSLYQQLQRRTLAPDMLAILEDSKYAGTPTEIKVSTDPLNPKTPNDQSLTVNCSLIDEKNVVCNSHKLFEGEGIYPKAVFADSRVLRNKDKRLGEIIW